MKFPRVAKKDPIEINLAPMIDVMLVLLVFFVMTTTFTKTHKSQLQVSLPSVQGVAPEVTPETLEIGISEQGDYTVNGQLLANQDAETLQRALRQALAQSPNSDDVPVVITADAQATHQSVVTAMDSAGQVGLTHLSITTIKETRNP